jgi:hypothetical protein
MLSKMIKYRRVFGFEEGKPSIEVPCQESGEPLPDYADLVAKLQLEVELGNLVDQGVRKYEFGWVAQRLVCACGRVVSLETQTNRCPCGRQYGLTGQCIGGV